MKRTLCLLLLSLLPTGAYADVRYTMRTTFADPQAAGMKMSTVTSVKDKRQRIEDVTEVQGMKTSSVRLILCDTEQEAELDPELKIYTLKKLQPDLAPPTEKGYSAGTGTLTMSYTVQDKGTQKIAGLDARHYLIDQQMKGSGCVGTFDHTSRREIWTHPLPVFRCPVLEQTWATQSSRTVDQCKLTVTSSGDVEAFNRANQDTVVKEIVYQDTKPLMTRELVEYSTAALDPALFTLDGYREVSRAEFDQARQEKMMKLYMKGAE